MSEPVRGGFPDPSFHARPGLERARAYVRGVAPRPPLSHPFGYRVTQAGPGTATLTMPASPWLQGLSDTLFVEVLTEAALAMAATTGAGPGMAVQTMSSSVSRFRPATPDSGTLVARARTVNSGRTFTFNEVVVDDSLGRRVLQATGAAVFRPVTAPSTPPGRLDEAAPIDPPIYPTADPHQRPLPPGVAILKEEAWDRHDGPTIARMYAAGQLPEMPIAALLRFRIFEWDEGRVHVAMPATDWLRGESDGVAPGVIALLANSVLGGRRPSNSTVAAPRLASWTIRSASTG